MILCGVSHQVTQCEQSGKQTTGKSSFTNNEQKSCKFDFISHGKGKTASFSVADNSQYSLTRKAAVFARHGDSFLQSQQWGSRGKRDIASLKPSRATQKDCFTRWDWGVKWRHSSAIKSRCCPCCSIQFSEPTSR